MESVLTNPTFLAIVGAIGFVLPIILGLVWKNKPIPKAIKQWLPPILTAGLTIVAFILWGAFKEWASWQDWLVGVTAALGTSLVIYRTIVKPLIDKQSGMK